MWLEKNFFPPETFAGFIFQRMIGSLRVEHLVAASEILTEIKNLRAELNVCDAVYPGESSNVRSRMHRCTYLLRYVYGQAGTLTGVPIKNSRGDDYFFFFECSSSKQRPVTYSSDGAVVIAAAKDDNCTFHFKEALQALGPVWEMESIITVDWKAL